MKRSPFKDKLARSIKWAPTHGAWRANFNQYRLYQFGRRGKMFFSLSLSGLLFWSIFIFFDLCFIVFGLLTLLFTYQSGALLIVKVSLLSLNILFLSIISVWLYFTIKEMVTAMQPIIFNFARGLFIKGWSQWFWSLRHGRKAISYYDATNKNIPIALSDIIALQLLSKGFRHRRDKARNYDINLILRDKTQIHLSSYFKEARAQRDIEKLSTRLGVRILRGEDQIK